MFSCYEYSVLDVLTTCTSIHCYIELTSVTSVPCDEFPQPKHPFIRNFSEKKTAALSTTNCEFLTQTTLIVGDLDENFCET